LDEHKKLIETDQPALVGSEDYNSALQLLTALSDDD